MALLIVDGHPPIFAALTRYILSIFDDTEEQQKEFNSAVVAFSLCLKHGFDPSAVVSNPGLPQTISDLADFDPDFTAVAWRLALMLNGWSPPDHRSDGESALSETISGQEELKSGGVAYIPEDLQEDRSIPGAWIDEEAEPDFPIVRKTRSTPDNFTGTINGHVWEPSLYTNGKSTSQA